MSCFLKGDEGRGGRQARLRWRGVAPLHPAQPQERQACAMRGIRDVPAVGLWPRRGAWEVACPHACPHARALHPPGRPAPRARMLPSVWAPRWGQSPTCQACQMSRRAEARAPSTSTRARVQDTHAPSVRASEWRLLCLATTCAPAVVQTQNALTNEVLAQCETREQFKELFTKVRLCARCEVAPSSPPPPASITLRAPRLATVPFLACTPSPTWEGLRACRQRPPPSSRAA